MSFSKNISVKEKVFFRVCKAYLIVFLFEAEAVILCIRDKDFFWYRIFTPLGLTLVLILG